ncbi:small Rab GTPase [Trichomonas vaginalis G3]|uniref:Ras-related protein Rab-1 n=1 Tax=Trichomonas vaginalis TaxID=5722 RepID=Q0PH39_TRIVA|nr:small Rab GTPase [Trichomonas vaginalis G3]ABH06562.1 small Rab GTPase [Trichomonas vaginalis]ABH06563.1 small Rab GTPase [Trichomonas vaginalis]KAI5528417.1 small Rab GTPase [Trichomonas vaginalis G3]
MSNDYDLLFKVLIVGESGVGKSCLLLRFTEDLFIENYISTIGVDFKIRTIEQEGAKVKLQIWDTAGQERFRAITKSYYHGSNGIVVVYDITDRKTFEKISDWFEQINTSEPNEDSCKILIGNKCDLNESRQVSLEEGEQLARDYNVPFMETSAKDSINVDNLFDLMARAMREKSGKFTTGSSNGNVSLKKGQSIGKKGCC